LPRANAWFLQWLRLKCESSLTHWCQPVGITGIQTEFLNTPYLGAANANFKPEFKKFRREKFSAGRNLTHSDQKYS